MSKKAFAYNDKYNPHSYYLSRTIDLSKRINLERKRENIIGVDSLCKNCPLFNDYFNYETKQHRRFSQLILEPFERDMDNLVNIKWEYIGDTPANFNEFKNKMIKFEHIDYPENELKEFRGEKNKSKARNSKEHRRKKRKKDN